MRIKAEPETQQAQDQGSAPTVATVACLVLGVLAGMVLVILLDQAVAN